MFIYIARLLRVTNGNNEVSYWHFDDGASARRESNEANAFFPRVLRCNAAFPVVCAVTTYTFSIRISTAVWSCQISIIGCPFRPTDGYSRNDVITNKSASMLLPGKIAGQSVYLLDDTDIEIVILVSRIFAISAARYRRVDCAGMTFVYIYIF